MTHLRHLGLVAFVLLEISVMVTLAQIRFRLFQLLEHGHILLIDAVFLVLTVDEI